MSRRLLDGQMDEGIFGELASYRATSRIIGAATDVSLPDDVEKKLLAFLMSRPTS